MEYTEYKDSNLPRWYEILLWEPYVTYIESDPDYDRDINDNQSMFHNLSSAISGLLLANIVKDRPIMNMGFDDHEAAAYLFFMQSSDEGKDIESISKSLSETIGNNWYDIDPMSLTPFQLAFLIIYPFMSRMDGSFELEFAESGKLKKYIRALKAKHQEVLSSK